MSAVGTTMTVVAGLQALNQLLQQAQVMSDILIKARLEGRDKLNQEEWATVLSSRNNALARLDSAIKVAEVNGGPAKTPTEPVAVPGTPSLLPKS